jgi:hypothetical protein
MAVAPLNPPAHKPPRAPSAIPIDPEATLVNENAKVLAEVGGVSLNRPRLLGALSQSPAVHRRDG